MQKLDTTNTEAHDGGMYLMSILFFIGILNDALSL
jgi:hypothetical protein